MEKLSHLNKKDQPAMVDVSEKRSTRRTAIARCIVKMPESVLEILQSNQFSTKKGSVFQTAIIAGIMAAKKTGELIPLCHPLGLANCEIDIELTAQREIVIQCLASVDAKTGVEMEALTGVSIAALTIYVMCRALSHNIVISEMTVVEKRGGKHDFSRR